MFDALSDRLGNVFDRLKGKGSLSESDVNAAMREVRIALLEADVAVEVVKSFIDGVKERAVGQEVTKSVTPGQQVIKIVNDNLIEMLGKEPAWIELNAVPPVPILMIGLQGSGKTTTAAKIASRLTRRDKKKKRQVKAKDFLVVQKSDAFFLSIFCAIGVLSIEYCIHCLHQTSRAQMHSEQHYATCVGRIEHFGTRTSCHSEFQQPPTLYIQLYNYIKA